MPYDKGMNNDDGTFAAIHAAVKAVETRVGLLSLEASIMRSIQRKMRAGKALTDAEAQRMCSEIRLLAGEIAPSSKEEVAARLDR